jgi:hypothetical protein
MEALHFGSSTAGCRSKKEKKKKQIFHIGLRINVIKPAPGAGFLNFGK